MAKRAVQAAAIRQAVPKIKDAVAWPAIHCQNNMSPAMTRKTMIDTDWATRMNVRRTRRAGDNGCAEAGDHGFIGRSMQQRLDGNVTLQSRACVASPRPVAGPVLAKSHGCSLRTTFACAY